MALYEVTMKIAVNIEAPTGAQAKARIDKEKLEQILVNTATRNDLAPFIKPKTVRKIV